MHVRNFSSIFLVATIVLGVSCHGKSASGADAKVATNETNFHKLPDSYWKGKLTPEVYEVTRKKAPSPLLAANTGTTMKAVFIPAATAVQNFSLPIQNLNLVLVGQVFIKPIQKQYQK